MSWREWSNRQEPAAIFRLGSDVIRLHLDRACRRTGRLEPASVSRLARMRKGAAVVRSIDVDGSLREFDADSFLGVRREQMLCALFVG